MIERFAQFPRALAERARKVSLAGVPALLAHPDWRTPCPVMVWMHGRTVSKELDPGRYARWMRAGIAACALDLPGHGERYAVELHHPRKSAEVVQRMTAEVDAVVDALAAPEWKGVFDLDRVGIGGMSAGGMCTLRRLCDPHEFVCAAVEGTTGWLEGLYFPAEGRPPWGVEQDPAIVREIDPMARLEGWRPLPLLALHAEGDRVVPIQTLKTFLEALRQHYRARHADPALIELRTWAKTGAPEEHAGFGKFGHEAKNAQVEFLSRWLKPDATVWREGT